MRHVLLVCAVMFAVGCDAPHAFLTPRHKQWAIAVVKNDKRPRIKPEVLTGKWRASDGGTLVFGEDGTYIEGRLATTYRLEGHRLVLASSGKTDRWLGLKDRDTLRIRTADRKLKSFSRLR